MPTGLQRSSKPRGRGDNASEWLPPPQDATSSHETDLRAESHVGLGYSQQRDVPVANGYLTGLLTDLQWFSKPCWREANAVRGLFTDKIRCAHIENIVCVESYASPELHEPTQRVRCQRLSKPNLAVVTSKTLEFGPPNTTLKIRNMCPGVESHESPGFRQASQRALANGSPTAPQTLLAGVTLSIVTGMVGPTATPISTTGKNHFPDRCIVYCLAEPHRTMPTQRQGERTP